MEERSFFSLICQDFFYDTYERYFVTKVSQVVIIGKKWAKKVLTFLSQQKRIFFGIIYAKKEKKRHSLIFAMAYLHLECIFALSATFVYENIVWSI